MKLTLLKTCLFAALFFVAVRVIGRPSSGDNPAQAFASCNELELLVQ